MDHVMKKLLIPILLFNLSIILFADDYNSIYANYGFAYSGCFVNMDIEEDDEEFFYESLAFFLTSRFSVVGDISFQIGRNIFIGPEIEIGVLLPLQGGGIVHIPLRFFSRFTKGYFSVDPFIGWNNIFTVSGFNIQYAASMELGTKIALGWFYIQLSGEKTVIGLEMFEIPGAIRIGIGYREEWY
jgi:hypothetical protein